MDKKVNLKRRYIVVGLFTAIFFIRKNPVSIGFPMKQTSIVWRLIQPFISMGKVLMKIILFKK